jgi:hypothetical protein
LAPRLVPSEIVAVIDELFPYAASGKATEKLGIDVNGRVSALISLVDRLPAELVALPPKAFADYITQLEILRVKNATAMTHGSGYRYSAQPVCALRKHLAACPDEAVIAAALEFLFVDPPELRDDLQIDLAESYDSLHAGRFKAATVLAGAVIEALLVWRLSNLTSTSLALPSESSHRPDQTTRQKVRSRSGDCGS